MNLIPKKKRRRRPFKSVTDTPGQLLMFQEFHNPITNQTNFDYAPVEKTLVPVAVAATANS